MSEPLRAMSPAPEGGELQVMGREIVRAFLLALRSLRSHGPQNQITVAAVKGLVKAFNRGVLRGGDAELRVVEEFVYFGPERLRLPRSDRLLISAVVEELAWRGVGSISLSIAVTEHQVAALLDAFQRHHRGGEACLPRLCAELLAGGSPFRLSPGGTLNAGRARDGDPPAVIPALAAAAGNAPGAAESSPPRVEVSKTGQDPQRATRGSSAALGETARRAEDRNDASAAGRSRDRCRQAFLTAMAVHRAYYRGAQAGEPLPIRHVKRTVQSLVDVVLEAEPVILGLTALRAHDTYAFFHSVNVCILSVGLGKRLGLDRDRLVDLGLAALLHDLGKAAMPAGILTKEDKLTPAELAQIQTHPHLGVRELLRFGGLNPQLYPAMVGCFEHHLNYDGSGSGYPRTEEPYRPHLFGRIVAIADCFDALSSKRAYRKQAQPHDRTLAYLLSQSGTKFDPVLLKLFINLIGVYPIGSIVRLRSGRVGVVVSSPPEPSRCHRPRVRLLDPQTHEPRSEFVDLDREEEEGARRDAVLWILDTDRARTDLRRVFL